MKKAMVAICLLLCAVIVIQAASADSRPDGFWRFETVTSENGASIIWVDWIPALCREAAKDNGNFRIGIKFVNQVGWITTNSDKAQYKLSTAGNQDLFGT